jgi:probable addiction module antidote protein
MTMRETKRFDAAKYIETPEDERIFLGEALKTRHAGHIARALGIIARARGMSDLARETGLNRATLYSALAEDGNPTLDTVLKITAALGLQLTVEEAEGKSLEDA